MPGPRQPACRSAAWSGCRSSSTGWYRAGCRHGDLPPRERASGRACRAGRKRSVDVPEVVADRVIAMLGELDRRAPPPALAFALHPADEDLPADQLELLELVQKVGIKQRGRSRPALRRGPW